MYSDSLQAESGDAINFVASCLTPNKKVTFDSIMHELSSTLLLRVTEGRPCGLGRTRGKWFHLPLTCPIQLNVNRHRLYAHQLATGLIYYYKVYLNLNLTAQLVPSIAISRHFIRGKWSIHHCLSHRGQTEPTASIRQGKLVPINFFILNQGSLSSSPYLWLRKTLNSTHLVAINHSPSTPLKRPPLQRQVVVWCAIRHVC